MSSSLRVEDPRARTRSKSPGGRSRDRSRSRSRDSRVPSPSPSRNRSRERERPETTRSKQAYDSDTPEEEYYPRRRSGRKYDASDVEEDGYRYRSKTSEPADRYYHSDMEEDPRKYRPSNGRPSKYRQDPDSEEDDRYGYASSHGGDPRYPNRYADSLTDSDDDDDDDALAYGEMNDRYSAKDYSRGSAANEKSSRYPSKYYTQPSPPGSPMPRGKEYERGPGTHPSYARPEKFNYVNPQLSQPGYKPPQSDWAEVPECERPGFIPPAHLQQHHGGNAPVPSPYAQPDPSLVPGAPGQYANLPPQQYVQPTYGQMPSTGAPNPYPFQAEAPGHPRTQSFGTAAPHQYATPPKFQYAQPDPNIKYSSKSAAKDYKMSENNQFTKAYTQSAEPQYIDVKPGDRIGHGKKGRPHSLSVSSQQNTLMPGSFPSDAGRPPASPLLEAYRGTYQSISPMPSPIMRHSNLDDEISDVEPLSGKSDSEKRGKKSKDKLRKMAEKEKKEKKDKKGKKDKPEKLEKYEKYKYGKYDDRDDENQLSKTLSGDRRISSYNPTADAKTLKSALSHHRVDAKPLLTILPFLTAEELLVLRDGYKEQVKMSGKGVNVAKHIKVKVPGNFGKVSYATALGRWESEAYWANCWYQSNNSRRELLIESLIGRTNSEIREIKKCFRDKRYGDSLERCMKSELKADKFRTAILLALEEVRQSDQEPLSLEHVYRDVKDLHKALVSREGGETAMIEIIVVRSDSHLREVLFVYEQTYEHNFAREMIKKSRNLVVSTLRA